MVACNYCESRAVSARSNASTEVRDVSIFHAILPLAESGYDPRGGGLGFGPLFGNTAKLRSPRYGREADPPYCYPAQSLARSWQYRALALNTYLLDNCLPHNSGNAPCAYKPHASPYPGAPPSGLSKRELVRWIVQQAYAARVNQQFEDGNHRTAVLSIYEKLADAGWMLTADAFAIYIAISNRQHHETIKVEKTMIKRTERDGALSVDSQGSAMHSM
ncbi:hypothetical protein WJX74_001999 [Apatococcus lobatus]|uniref:Fido domain-containing protein n=1 Tax=Apatococcus lobatus TaxID=904363 RepID=A0AAW1QDR8_9CHLO